MRELQAEFEPVDLTVREVQLGKISGKRILLVKFFDQSSVLAGFPASFSYGANDIDRYMNEDLLGKFSEESNDVQGPYSTVLGGPQVYNYD